MNTRIDHLVIAAKTLETGVEYIKETLGVEMPYGGEHLKMGTHNHLMKIGEGIFLEVIAVNLKGKTPERPRWFGFDDPFVSARIKDKPGLLTWVVNTDDIFEVAKNASFSMGKPTLIERGDLNWYFALPDDGRLLGSGMLPYAIKWNTKIHPSANMGDLKCSFKYLEIFHPYPKWLKSSLESIGADELVRLTALSDNEKPYITAVFETPSGLKTLKSI